MLCAMCKASGESMDIVFLVGAAALFVAMLGMVIGCDKLGARK